MSLPCRRKKNRTHSLTNQITVTFIGLLFLSILAITMINRVFLERYYISRKTGVLLEAKESLQMLDFETLLHEEKGEEETQEVYSDPLQKSSYGQNYSWVILNPDSASTVCWPSDDLVLRSKVFGYAFGVDEDSENARLLKKAKDHIVQMVYDRYHDMDYLECWGRFEKGYYFLIRTPLESIRESADISNTFYLMVGIVIILVSGFLISLVTRRITRPIGELTALSEKMASLDFEARYSSHAGNEIDLLGENFNHMSDQLRDTISDLKTANLELTRDIADKVKIDEMRKEFLNNVSHELKTPLALIQGYAEGLRDGVTEDPESMAYYCDVIVDEAGKMNQLVRSLLTLNQLESGRDAPVMERFDLAALVRGALGKMNLLLGQAGAQVEFEEKEPVYVWADEFKTEEVVTNYLSNALHHLKGEKRIRITLKKEEGRVRTLVFNSGDPIPQEDLPHLWNKFYKVDKARTREYGGSGIGLSIVKAIQEGMQQEYGVRNCPGGVEFWFTLSE